MKAMGFRVINTGERLPCPICGGGLNAYGWRERKVIESDGGTKLLLIHRLLCTKCGGIHHELPDILVPYKRHCAETIEKVISGKSDDVYCEGSTIRRIQNWWQILYIYFQGVCAALTAKHFVSFSEPLQPREVVLAVANAHLWVSTRSACPSG